MVTDEQLAECTDDEPTVSDEQLATWHRWGAQARVFGDSPEEKRLGHAVVALAAEVRTLRSPTRSEAQDDAQAHDAALWRRLDEHFEALPGLRELVAEMERGTR